ncbi:YciC family protein [Providencia sneebia]|uniref:UPF0259 membrane protein OO7_09807 n=1 Tax=Providencia sneebia DSM 19967 TaxID=1141660 RepID=K8WJ24_9GAMM|nr:YciC family protein [Providencia sneebia]EKT56225.1 hypothetical protein OO7_09807 [Providencia sneebia DSM 19967]
MSISANSLISDSINFFKNQSSGLSTIIVLATAVSTIIYALMIPNAEMIATFINTLVDAQTKFIDAGNDGMQSWIQDLPEDNRSSIMRVSLGLLLSVTIGRLVLICGVLSYIARLSRGENITAIQALTSSLPKAVSMFLLLIICSLLVQLGIAIMIVPGVIFAIGFSLAPAILISENINVFSAIAKSWKLAYANWRFVFPIILIWMATQMLVGLLISNLNLNHIVGNGLSFLLNNVIAAFALIYFYRLYMLISEKQ